MKNIYKFTLLLIAIMIVSISAASAADADDLLNMTSVEGESTPLEVDDSVNEVQTSGNDENEVSSLETGDGDSATITDEQDNEKLGASSDEEKLQSTPGTFSDLKEKIDDAIANHSGVLDLTYDFKFNSAEDGNYYGGINLGNKILVINGNGHTISGNNLTRIFYKYGGWAEQITLNNIKFIEGIADTEKGGAICLSVFQGNLIINDCTFESNNAQNGGAIYSQIMEGSVTINRSTFKNNKATASKEAGGAIESESGRLNVYNSNFESNLYKTTPNSIMSKSGQLYLENNTINKEFAEIYTIDTIRSYINATVLENRTVTMNTEDSVKINASVTDDNGNLIYGLDNKGQINLFKITYNGMDYLSTIPSYTGYTLDFYLSFGEEYMMSMIYKGTGGDFHVNNGVIECVPPKGTYTDLNAQIKAIQDGEELNLTYDFTYNPQVDSNFNNGIHIDKTVIINGNGHTISGNKSNRVFSVDSYENS